MPKLEGKLRNINNKNTKLCIRCKLTIMQCVLCYSLNFFGATAPPTQWARASSFTRFLDNTQRRTTVGMTALDECLVRRRDLHLTIHNNRKRQTSMPPEGSERTISADERPQTYALDRAATGTGYSFN